MQLSLRRLSALAAPVLLALTLGTLAPATPASANDLFWLPIAGGSATVAANWYDSDDFTYHVPGPGDYAILDVSSGYNIQWASPADSLWGINLATGRPRFNITGTLGLSNGMSVNVDSLTLLSGLLRTPTMYVGWDAPSTLLGSGASQIVFTDSTSGSLWGNGYRTRVTLIGGARIRSNGYIDMAHGLSDVCTTTVIGRQSFPTIYSGLTTMSAVGGGYRGDMIVGTNGTALLQLQNGGFADIAGDLFVSKGTLSQGMVHLYNTPTGIGSPSLTVHGETVLGNPDPAVYQYGYGEILCERGSVNLLGPCLLQYGMITIRNGASFTGGDVAVSPTPGASGTWLSVRGAGTQATINSSLQVGAPNMSTTGANAGLSVDSSATLTYSGTSTLSEYSNGTIWVANGATLLSTADVEVEGETQVFSTLQAPRFHIKHVGSDQSTLDTYMNAVIRARMALDPGARIWVNGTGNLVTIGDSTATDGFVSSGSTSMGADTLVVLDKDGAELGSLTVGTGTLRVPSGGHLASGKSLFGSGRFEGNLTNEGTITVPSGYTLLFAGHLTQLTGLATGPGTISIPVGSTLSARGSIDPIITLGGALDFGPNPSLLSAGHGIQAAGTATMTFRVGSKASGIQDAMFVTGTATLGGKLDVRSVLDNLMSPGDTITIITASAISGTFSSVKYNGGGPGGAISVLYSPTSVRIVAINPLLAADGGDAPGQPLRFACAGTLHAPAMALDLPTAANVKVALYDVAGRQVAVLAQGMLAAGRHQMALANTGVTSGVYFGRAVVTGASGTRALTARVVMLR